MSYQNLKMFFNPTIYRRGKSYYDMGAVHILKHTNGHIIASVDGSETYRSEMYYNNSAIVSYSCSCPYTGACKHIAALVEYLIENPSPQQVDNYKPLIDNFFNTLICNRNIKEPQEALLSKARSCSPSDLTEFCNNYINALFLRFDKKSSLKEPIIIFARTLFSDEILFNTIADFIRSNYRQQKLRFDYFCSSKECQNLFQKYYSSLIKLYDDCSFFYDEENIDFLVSLTSTEQDFIFLLGNTNEFYLKTNLDEFYNTFIQKKYFKALRILNKDYYFFLSDTQRREIIDILLNNNREEGIKSLFDNFDKFTTLRSFINLYSKLTEDERKSYHDQLFAIGENIASEMMLYIDPDHASLSQSEFNRIAFRDLLLLKDKIMSSTLADEYIKFYIKKVNAFINKKNKSNEDILSIIGTLFYLSKPQFVHFIKSPVINQEITSDDLLNQEYLHLMVRLNAYSFTGYHSYED